MKGNRSELCISPGTQPPVPERIVPLDAEPADVVGTALFVARGVTPA
jgi:hypothetical protein